MCVICDGMTHEQYWAQMRDRISRAGWTSVTVEGEVSKDHIHPAFAYTVGFTRHRLPEIIITGRVADEAVEVLDTLAADARRGHRLAAGNQLHAGGLCLVLVDVDETQDWLIQAHNIYPNRTVRALQAVWADGDGRYPWAQEPPDTLTQPLLGRPPGHHRAA